MSIGGILRSVLFALAVFAFALFVGACGGHKRTLTSFEGVISTQAENQSHEIALDDALAELDALAVPDGVKSQVFQQLKDALENALSERGTGKVTCTPPKGEANRVNDLAIVDNGDSTHSLIWHYRSLGDYNQDGNVGIADITPLAQHFGGQWTVGEENTLAAVIDGSGNKAIDIADVTPIAVNFGSQVDHYAVEGSDTSDSGFALVEAYPLPASDDISRTILSHNLGAAPAFTYWRVVPVDAGSVQGDYSNVAQVGEFIWHLKTLDGGITSGGEYTSLAVVNGKPAVSYQNHLDGDLRYVQATVASGTTWGTPLTVDSTQYVGQYSSLAVVNGNPAISYYDADSGNLKYVRASDADGNAWAAPVVVTSTGNIGQYTSLVVVNGNPAISYYDVVGLVLMYVRADDADGTAWGTPVLVDDAGDVGQFGSMEVVNGRPAISYFDNTNDDLKYVRASDADGTAWGPRVVVYNVGSVGTDTSLEVVNGNPAISFYDVGNMILKYVRASDANGDGWNAPVTADNWARTGRSNSLAVINGNPAISYAEELIFSLRYVRALDANGTVWGEPVVANDLKPAYYTSLAEVNGNPAISYNGNGLRYAYYF